jgi:hypothetical protein
MLDLDSVVKLTAVSEMAGCSASVVLHRYKNHPIRNEQYQSSHRLKSDEMKSEYGWMDG